MIVGYLNNGLNVTVVVGGYEGERMVEKIV
jgi:hypothetical protein